MHDKKKLSERDICTQYITPALQRAGWDFATQVREEVTFTKGRVIVRGKPTTPKWRSTVERLKTHFPGFDTP